MSETIKATNLAALITAENPPVIIDVRLEEDYQVQHLPTAVGNCVYEMTFVDRIAEIVPEKSQLIVVYGEHASSYESRLAAEKLERLGYSNVKEMRIGILGWINEGHEFIGSEKDDPIVPMLANGRHEIDLSESRIQWTGRNLLNSHFGMLKISAGWIETAENIIEAGEFTIDFSTMRCTDLAGDKLHDVLIAHLASDDFFDIEHHPTASFTVQRGIPIPDAHDGQPNLRIEGILEIKGHSVPTAFQAVCGVTSDGKGAAQATLSIDRTLWGIIYGSGQFFARVGMHLVNDLIDIELRIVTK